MRTCVIALAIALAWPAAAGAQTPADPAVMAVISRMTDAANKGDAPTVFAAFTAAPTIVEDLAPYRWQGPGTPQAWLEGMGANAQAHGITTVNMKLSPATRVDVVQDHAYAVVPGRLSYVLKDGHAEHADGVITFTLLRLDGAWKIDTLVWSGPVASR
jgi:ketosteroid isomerase-like protein